MPHFCSVPPNPNECKRAQQPFSAAQHTGRTKPFLWHTGLASALEVQELCELEELSELKEILWLTGIFELRELSKLEELSELKGFC